MIIPLPDITNYRGFHLPDAHHVVLNEGHVVAMGPRCEGHVGIGDCVVWEKHAETRWKSEDGSVFVTVNESTLVMKIPSSVLTEEREYYNSLPIEKEAID